MRTLYVMFTRYLFIWGIWSFWYITRRRRNNDIDHVSNGTAIVSSRSGSSWNVFKSPAKYRSTRYTPIQDSRIPCYISLKEEGGNVIILSSSIEIQYIVNIYSYWTINLQSSVTIGRISMAKTILKGRQFAQYVQLKNHQVIAAVSLPYLVVTLYIIFLCRRTAFFSALTHTRCLRIIWG